VGSNALEGRQGLDVWKKQTKNRPAASWRPMNWICEDVVAGGVMPGVGKTPCIPSRTTVGRRCPRGRLVKRSHCGRARRRLLLWPVVCYDEFGEVQCSWLRASAGQSLLEVVGCVFVNVW